MCSSQFPPFSFFILRHESGRPFCFVLFLLQGCLTQKWYVQGLILEYLYILRSWQKWNLKTISKHLRNDVWCLFHSSHLFFPQCTSCIMFLNPYNFRIFPCIFFQSLWSRICLSLISFVVRRVLTMFCLNKVKKLHFLLTVITSNYELSKQTDTQPRKFKPRSALKK